MIFHVIDDQPVICEFISSALQLLGHEAQTFQSSVEYLDYLNCDGYQNPAAVFTDVFMPVVNGLELVKKVQAIHPGQLFVIISGMPNIEAQCRGDNCLFLKKPFGTSQLEEVIVKLAQQKTGQPIQVSASPDQPQYH